MKMQMASLCCLILVSACDGVKTPSPSQSAGDKRASSAAAAPWDSASLIPCPELAVPNAQNPTQKLIYEIGDGGKIYTILERNPLPSDPGLQTYNDTFLVGNTRVAERRTTEWFGLFVVETQSGEEIYHLEINDLKPELMGQLLSGKQLDLDGQFHSNLGGAPTKGESKIRILLRGCKPGPLHTFQVIDQDGERKSENFVDYDAQRNLVIRSHNTKTGAFVQISE